MSFVHHLDITFKSMYIEIVERIGIIKVVEGLPKLLRVFREGLA